MARPQYHAPRRPPIKSTDIAGYQDRPCERLQGAGLTAVALAQSPAPFARRRRGTRRPQWGRGDVAARSLAGATGGSLVVTK